MVHAVHLGLSSQEAFKLHQECQGWFGCGRRQLCVAERVGWEKRGGHYYLEASLFYQEG